VDGYAARCTACGGCVRACPSGVLRQAAIEFGLGRPGIPYLDYGRAFCQYECVACAAACPSGALLPRAPELKKREAIGKSALVLADCIVVAKGTRCGACAEHCPTGAVRIEALASRPLPVPVLHLPTCIGCGACETVCPASPRKAMLVSGLSVHGLADPPRKEAALPVEEPSTEGFAF
jgi:ferredoxin